ncbi:MAG: SusC/RagA family TonB-linked outer membrane protein [Bacteroidales bacterium]|nr:SusC/RagA family TonB-linked outer membrane protein [Bacteroidales bacterium]
MKNKNAKNRSLAGKIVSMLFFLLISGTLLGQGVSVSGTITDEQGLPLPGVNIIEEGTNNGVTTNIDGKYSIEVSGQDAVLKFSFIGFTPQEENVGSRRVIDIVLMEGLAIDEVVVTALGITRESKALGYAVSKVEGSVLAETGQTNVISALAGRVAGVQITGSSSGVDGTNRIVIRGETSLSNDNQPLIVVDGIPIQANQQLDANTIPDYSGVHDWGSPIADINPSDIENLTVLKGASATALYGSRAANGVILITTKTARQGQKGFGVSFNTSLTIQNPLIKESAWQKEYGQGFEGMYEYVDGEGNGTNEQTYYQWGPKFEGQMINQWDAATGEAVSKPWEYHDNWNNFFDTGILTNNTLALSYAGESSSSRVSISYQKEKGIVPTTGLNRVTANFNNNFIVNEKLRVHLRGTLSNMDSPNRSGYGYSNPIRDVYNMPANIDILDLKEYYKTAQGDKNSYYDNGPNPFFDLYENSRPSTRNRISLGATARYNVTKEIYVEGTVSNDLTRNTWKQINAKWKYNDGSYSQGSGYDQELNANVRIGIDKQFSDLSINAFVGSDYRNIQHYSESAGTEGGLINRGVYNLDNSKNDTWSDHYFSEKEVHSLLGNVSLGYRNFIYLDLSERMDWSSTLPAENRMYSYPSVSTSFIFTEAFDLQSDILTFGKIRASWAQVGSDTGPYNLNLYIDRSGSSWGDQPIQYVNATLPPTNLKPEITSSKEIGLMVSLFDNKINLDVAYYHTNTKNQIVTIDTQWERGFRYSRINVGNLENKGLEIALNTTPVKTGDFRWDLGFTYTRNRGKLLELYGDLTHQRIGEWYGSETRASVGDRYGSSWGFPYMMDSEESWNALYPQQQDMNLEDLYGTGEILTKDGVPMHTVWRGGPYAMNDYFTPDFLGSISSTVSYKNFSLSVLIDARIGGQMISTTYQHGYLFGVVESTAGLNQLGNPRRDPVASGGGTLIEGTDIDTGLPNTTYIETEDWNRGWNHGTTDFMFDATNVKLRDIVLTYKIPTKIAAKANLQNLTFSLVGHNVLLLVNKMPGIDSETSMGYNNKGQGLEVASVPSTRSLGFKLSASF